METVSKAGGGAEGMSLKSNPWDGLMSTTRPSTDPRIFMQVGVDRIKPRAATGRGSSLSRATTPLAGFAAAPLSPNRLGERLGSYDEDEREAQRRTG
jgi:hypothetical protein